MYGAGIIPVHFCGDNIRILLVKAKISEKWGFQKGHLEKNEELKDTAIREMKEETGIDIDYSDLKTFLSFGDYRMFLVRMYKLEKVTKQETEIIDAKWMLLEDIMRMDMSEVNYSLKLFRFSLNKDEKIKKFIKQNNQKIYIMEP